jgi:sugar-phosphatase
MAGRRIPRTGFDAAVFDMDGLLIDSEPVWRRAEIEVFARLGVSLTEEACLETRGMLVSEVARHWYGIHRWAGPGPDDVADEVVETMAGILGAGVTGKPGAGQAIEWCRNRGLALAIASSSPRRLIEVVVERSGWVDLFAVLHSGQDEVAGKPDPAVFLRTATLLGVAPERCLVFEDSPAGIRAAVAAGMACVAVPEASVALTPDAVAALADVVLDSLADVDDGLWARLTADGRSAP